MFKCPPNIKDYSADLMCLMFILKQWFSIRGSFAPQLMFGQIWSHFWLSRLGESASGIQWAEVRLIAKHLQWPAQRQKQRINQPQSSNTKVEESCSKRLTRINEELLSHILLNLQLLCCDYWQKGKLIRIETCRSLCWVSLAPFSCFQTNLRCKVSTPPWITL